MWIEKLTPEQEALISVYRNKWIEIAFRTEPMDRLKASELVKKLYNLTGFKEPEIQFARSPYEALKMFLNPIKFPHQESREYWVGQFQKFSGEPLYMDLGNRVWLKISDRIQKQVENNLFGKIDEQLEDNRAGEIIIGLFKREPMHFLSRQLCSNMTDLMKQKSDYLKFLPEYFIRREDLIAATRCLDFCISVLHCDIDRKLWEVFASVLSECGWIYPWEKTCFICDRPIEIYFDPLKLRNEKKLAVQFSDGYSL